MTCKYANLHDNFPLQSGERSVHVTLLAKASCVRMWKQNRVALSHRRVRTGTLFGFILTKYPYHHTCMLQAWWKLSKLILNGMWKEQRHTQRQKFKFIHNETRLITLSKAEKSMKE